MPGVAGAGAKGESATTIPRYTRAATEIPKTTQRVQPGTKRPSGNRYRNRPKEAAPRKSRRDSGHHKEAYSIDSAYVGFGKPAIPKVSRAKEASIAIRSSDFRQKIMTATATYPAAKTTSCTTV